MRTRIHFIKGNLNKVFSDRTSAKIGLYNSSSRHQPADDEPNNDEQSTEELAGDETAKDKDDKPEVDPHVKSLIQSVAFEIQKSFSQRNLRKVPVQEHRKL
jgi:hypothetical protein